MVELKESLFRGLEVKDLRASYDSDFRKGEQAGLLVDIWMLLWFDFNSSVASYHLQDGKKYQFKYLILAYSHSLRWPVKLQYTWSGAASLQLPSRTVFSISMFLFGCFPHLYKDFPNLLCQLVLLIRNSRFKFPIHKIFFGYTASHRS